MGRLGELAVGAPRESDGGAATAGAIYLFEESGGSYASSARLGLTTPVAGSLLGVSLALSEDLLVAGAAGALTGDVAVGAAYLWRRDGAGWTGETRLDRSGGQRLDRFGSAVAVGDNLVAVTAPYADGGSPDTGSVTLFEDQGETWVERAVVQLPSAGEADRFGSTVALTQSELLVGAPALDQGAINSGAVVVFGLGPQNPDEVARLTGASTSFGYAFGFAVAMDGDLLAVGVPFEEVDGLTTAGAVHLFAADGGQWTRTARLTSPSPTAGEQLGVSVDLSGDTVVAGAWSNDTVAEDAGAAYVFSSSGGVWSHVQTLLPAAGRPFDFFGTSVAVDGSTLVVGSAGGSRATVYDRSGLTWTETQELEPFPRPSGDYFRAPVALDGDTIALGGRQDPDGPSAFVYARQGDQWSPQQRLESPLGADNPSFGDPVAVDGEHLVVGAPTSDQGGETGPGEVVVYVRGAGTWSTESVLSLSGATDPADGFGAAVALNGDVLAVGAPDAGEVAIFRGQPAVGS